MSCALRPLQQGASAPAQANPTQAEAPNVGETELHDKASDCVLRDAHFHPCATRLLLVLSVAKVVVSPCAIAWIRFYFEMSA